MSFRTSDMEALHANGPYQNFIMYDPDGHQLEINSYPDLALPKFRGY